jgi:hypothetical protein
MPIKRVGEKPAGMLLFRPLSHVCWDIVRQPFDKRVDLL